MTTTSQYVSAVALATLAAASLVGCGGKSSPASQPVTTISDYASTVLADGTVTRTEIEAARADTLGCLSAEGFSATFTARDERVSNLEVDSGSPAPGESDSEFEQRFDQTIAECTSTYLTAIDVAWLRATAPSEEERLAAFNTLQQCIEPYDVVVAGTDAKDLVDLLERIDSATTPADQRTALAECYGTYSLATATGEG